MRCLPVGRVVANQHNMAKRGRPKTLEFSPTKRRKALIEWNDPTRQAHVLDWRHRAQDFGLAVEPREDVDERHPFAVEPEQLLAEDEPEAFEDQHIEEEADDDQQPE